MPIYYDTPEQLNEYLVFHYGSDQDILKWDFGPKHALGFHQRLVQCIDFNSLPANASALDLGCAVGRITFELARGFDNVVGVDASKQFIQTAKEIQKTGKVALKLTREGNLGDPVSRLIEPEIDRSRIKFEQADAENLHPELGTFDAIVFANVLDRLPHPRQCLRKLADIINAGGQLIICSPFTWWDDFTEPHERLGGYVKDGTEVTSLDTITSILQEHFTLSDVQDQPFLIREHERKYHFSVAQTTIWVRK